MISSPFLLLFLLLALIPPRRSSISAAAGSNSKCYKRDGSVQTSDWNWLPCDPNAKASHCCSGGDFCMSNGLCLDDGGDPYYSAQGCSSPEWPQEGCREICNSTMRSATGYSYVWLCDGTISGDSIKYCCGLSSCCRTEPNLPSIRFGQAFFRPPQAASTSAPASASASAPASADIAPAQPTQPSQPSQSAHDKGNTNTNNTNSNDNNLRALEIGLGAGISLGLALLGGIIFLALQVRKWASAAKEIATAKRKTDDQGNIAGFQNEWGNMAQQLQSLYPSELNTVERRQELGGGRVEVE
ncbi:hypothetical protein PGQ11_006234 [Apiospora arundinis]|uniref:Uncharacterized protein n=1 Tax=Apiospora arundinis TaxID=335852 RepID=A0ABR2ITG0_9PEZI